MIPRNATLHAAWLPLEALVVRHGDHQTPMDIERIAQYRDLLRDAAQSTDPIVVVQDREGVYRVTNGRHRFMAHMVAGRDVIAAVIVNPQNEDG